jgi:hypothetical protein
MQEKTNEVVGKAFIQLKAQSVEQGVAATEQEIRYKLERDTALKELVNYSKKISEGEKAFGITPTSPKTVTDINGRVWTEDELDIRWR